MTLKLPWVKIFLATLVLGNLFLACEAWNKILQGQSDFIIYYTAAHMVKDHQGRNIYALEVQKQFQQKILNAIQSPVRFQDGLLPYNHPPFEVICFLLLAKLPYFKALLVWNIFSSVCISVGLILLIKDWDGHNKADVGLIVLGSLAFLPLLVTFLQGQDSPMLFLFLVLAFHNMKKSRDVRAGLWLSLILQKFQILMPILLLILAKKRWRILGGFLVGAVTVFLISLSIVGISGLKRYLHLVIEMTGWVNRYGIYPSKMHSVRGLVYEVGFESHPSFALGVTAAISFLLLGLLFKAWQGDWLVDEPLFDLKFALLILISLLVSFHLYFHDLLLLLLPGLLIYKFSLRDESPPSVSRWLAVTLFLVGFPVFLASFIVPDQIPIKLSVGGLLTLSGVLFHQLGVFKKHQACI